MRTSSRSKKGKRRRRRSSDGAATGATPHAVEIDGLHRGGPHDPTDDEASADAARTPVSPHDPSADHEDEEDATATAAGLGVSPHEMGGAESDAASDTPAPKSVAVTPRKRGWPSKRPASTTPTKATPPSKRKKQPRARAATLDDSPHVGGHRRKARSLSWVEEVSSDSIVTGFSRTSPIGAKSSEQKTARTVVVPGASLLGSPTSASSTWPPKDETKSSLRRTSATAAPDNVSESAVGGMGVNDDAPATRPADDGVAAVLTSGPGEDRESGLGGEVSATEVVAPVAAPAPPEDTARCSVEAEQSVDAAGAEAAIVPTEAAVASVDLSDESTDQPPMDAQSVILSPVQDEKKVTPRKSSASKKRRSLDATFAAAKMTEFSVDEVAELIVELYQEQEQDDRGMYSITTETVREQTAQCERSEEVEELSLEDFRRLLTYGEVSVESVSSTILPFLDLKEDDVLYDLGCGTGKILVQAVLQTKCAKAVGIELMQNRVQEGLRALDRLDKLELELLRTKSVKLVQGDICKPPASADMSDATVVFINNVMFGPKLMMKVMQQLESISNLKRIVTLRKVCERHRPNCQRTGNLCANYVDPPQKADIFVSWASKTQVYMYERLDYSLMKLSSTMQTAMSGGGALLAVAAVATEQQAAVKKARTPRKKSAEAKAAVSRRTAARKPTRAAAATTKRVRRR